MLAAQDESAIQRGQLGYGPGEPFKQVQAAGSGAVHVPPEYDPEVVLQAFDFVQEHPSIVGFVAQVGTISSTQHV